VRARFQGVFSAGKGFPFKRGSFGSAFCRAVVVELAERPHQAAGFKSKTIIAFEFREGPMSSKKKQTQSLHGNKTEQKSGFSRHYREIGIKAVAAATRKESTASPRARDSMAIDRKKE